MKHGLFYRFDFFVYSVLLNLILTFSKLQKDIYFIFIYFIYFFVQLQIFSLKFVRLISFHFIDKILLILNYNVSFFISFKSCFNFFI